MSQINFRVSDIEKQIIAAFAEAKGISIAEAAKKALLNEILPIREEIALDLFKNGKIGRKNAWLISGLSYRDFLLECSKRKITENIPDEIWDRQFDLMENFDFRPYMKTK